jgi:DNA-binding NtrC family response regulator
MHTATTGGIDLVLEGWKAPPSLSEDGLALYQLLRSTDILLGSTSPLTPETAGKAGARGVAEGQCREILKAIVSLLRAERAFLFELKTAVVEGESAVGPAIASSDLDGEPVREPERRVPMDVLDRAAREGVPELGPAAGRTGAPPEPDPQGVRGQSLVLPLEWDGERRAALYAENRFQPLDLGREPFRAACALSRLVGVILGWASLRGENADLWEDVRRVRQEASSLRGISPVEAPRSESPRHTRRGEIKGDYTGIIGSSPCMLEIFHIVDRISSSNVPVLINGESGTGKELIAQAVHRNSPRRDKVFVSENCGALTETLLESELFGYVKGAFTGAAKDHKGLFELAEGGTLFLDEVGDMSSGMQKKLLRVLQEGVIRRVGGKEYIPVNVRIISATNKDLLEEVKAGSFREDLYFRLNVINLRLPALRERKEDIPELATSFLDELAKESGTTKKIEPAALQRLMKYNWPGNVRELRNEIKRFFALSEGDIGVHDLSETILAGEKPDATFKSLGQEIFHLTLKDATERLEKEMIRNAIVQSRGNKSLVAKMLQVPKTSLYNKIAKYGLDRI